MKTETSDEQKVEPQESPVQDAESASQAVVPQESASQAVVPQESGVQAAVPQESAVPVAAAQESVSQSAVPQESPSQAAIAQESALQSTGPEESAHQDAGHHDSSPPVEALTEAPFADPLDSRQQSKVSNVRVALSDVASQSSREVRPVSSQIMLNALLAERKKYRVEEACLRLKEMEAERERKLQDERKLKYKKSKEKRTLSSANSEEKRKLSSQASVHRRKLSSQTSVDKRKGSSQASVDKRKGSSQTSEDRRKLSSVNSSTTEEEDEDIFQTKIEDGSEKQSVGSITTSKSVPLQADVEEVDRASYSFRSSSSTIEDAEDMDSEDVMRTAVNELMLVPSLSDLSLSDPRDLRSVLSSKSMKSIKSSKSVKSTKSTKSIVPDPGTTEPEVGSSESSSEETSSESRYESPQKIEDEGSQASDESVHPRASEFVDIPFDEVLFKQPDNALEAFFAPLAGKGAHEARDLLAIQKAIETERIIQGFLNMMIRNVIGSLDPYQYVRNQLDKKKLLNGLLEKVKEHIELMAVNQELNEQTVEYCRRTKNYRSFAELPEEESERYAMRYKAGLDYLAYGQTRVDIIKAKVGRLIMTAQLELCNVMHNSQGTEQHFEQTMRRVVIRPDSESDLLKRLVAYELRLMAETRNEISDTRFLLITHTHTLGKLQEQIKRLETLSETVSMSDFITLQTKVMRLEKKIEERNLDLKRLRSQYHTELHLTKHIREKALALKDRLNTLQEQLIEKNVVRKGLKDRLCHVKMEKKKIRAQTSELAYQGGILSMPSLMYDYDRTLLYIREKQESVSALKETMRSITQHLNSLWARETTKSTI